eukprot:c21231_g1_i1 orf=183-845(+)
MGQQSLIYTFVARGSIVLAEHTSFSGNFSTIAVQCLQKLPPNNNKFIFTCDGHTFNYIVEDGFAYVVVADEKVGRQVPFALLERIKEDFQRQYGGGRADSALAHSLDKAFGPRLRDHMQYCVDNPEEMDKVAKVKSQVSEVKSIIMDNIEKVLDRHEKIDVLVKQTENLRFQADDFQRQGQQLRRKMWLHNFKVKLVVFGILILVILIVWLSVCHGFKCK